MKLRTYQSLIARVGNGLRGINEAIAENASELGIYGEEVDKVLYSNLSKLQRERMKLEELQREIRGEYRDIVTFRRQMREEANADIEQAHALLVQAGELAQRSDETRQFLEATE